MTQTNSPSGRTEDDALKPCPFCGGKPYLANVAMVGCAYVVCTDCRMQSDDGGKDRVVAAWNRRADLAQSDLLADPRVTALVEAVGEGIRAGLLPKSSASEGGAAKYSAQVRAADRLRAALAAFDTTDKPQGANNEVKGGKNG